MRKPLSSGQKWFLRLYFLLYFSPQISGHLYSFPPPKRHFLFAGYLLLCKMFLKYAKCCSNMRNVAQIEQHFVYLSVNNNTHIKKTLHKVLQNIFFGGGKIHFGLCYTHMTSFQMMSAFLNQTSASKS